MVQRVVGDLRRRKRGAGLDVEPLHRGVVRAGADPGDQDQSDDDADDVGHQVEKRIEAEVNLLILQRSATPKHLATPPGSRESSSRAMVRGADTRGSTSAIPPWTPGSKGSGDKGARPGAPKPAGARSSS